MADLTPEQWSQQISTEIVTDVMLALEREVPARGREWVEIAKLNILGSLCCTMVLNVLRSEQPAKKTSEQQQQVEKVYSAYHDMKTAIEASIGSAFDGAMTEYSGSQREFYCIIRPVLKPVNIMPC